MIVNHDMALLLSADNNTNKFYTKKKKRRYAKKIPNMLVLKLHG